MKWNQVEEDFTFKTLLILLLSLNKFLIYLDVLVYRGRGSRDGQIDFIIHCNKKHVQTPKDDLVRSRRMPSRSR